MRHLTKKFCLPFLACALIIQVTSAAAQDSSNFMIGTDMMKPDLYLINTDSDKINTDSDKRVKLDLTKDPKWPGGLPLHTIIIRDGHKAYLSVMSSDKDPLTILALRINKI